jgi:hypothetical protein
MEISNLRKYIFFIYIVSEIYYMSFRIEEKKIDLGVFPLKFETK